VPPEGHSPEHPPAPSCLHIALHKQPLSTLQLTFPKLSIVHAAHLQILPSIGQYPRHEPLAGSISHPIHLQSEQTFLPVLSTVQLYELQVLSAGQTPAHSPVTASVPQGWAGEVTVPAGVVVAVAIAAPLQWHSAYVVLPVVSR
jgi:hypothetical protein